jgi:hypothetical protein
VNRRRTRIPIVTKLTHHGKTIHPRREASLLAAMVLSALLYWLFFQLF